MTILTKSHDPPSSSFFLKGPFLSLHLASQKPVLGGRAVVGFRV